MVFLVGLGNPGEKYASTRHNIGFMVIDRVLQDMVKVGNTWVSEEKFSAFVFKSGDLLFAKPQTFMNASGVAVKKLMDFYKIKTSQLWVIHDDIDLPLGKIRIRRGGGSAGHHGIESLLKSLGKDDFVRFRLGIGRGKLDSKKNTNRNLLRHVVEKFVISPFSRQEAGEMRKLVKQGSHAMEIALQKGLDRAMNEFN